MKKILGITFSRERLIKVGDVYEDCAYHPVLCTESDYKDDNLSGISLFDGSTPRSCSPTHCAPRLLTPAEISDKIKHRDEWLEAAVAYQVGREVHAYDALLQREYDLFYGGK
jgi:hypothetical protein